MDVDAAAQPGMDISLVERAQSANVVVLCQTGERSGMDVVVAEGAGLSCHIARPGVVVDVVAGLLRHTVRPGAGLSCHTTQLGTDLTVPQGTCLGPAN